MFHWFREHRRQKLTRATFPSSWEEIVRRNVAHYSMLEDTERSHLRALIQVFIAEKNWEGAGGLELDDEIRVTISAQACLLILALPHNYYQNVQSIIVYPSTVVPPQRKQGFFDNTIAPVEIEQPILGQAFLQGPVIIVWDAALHGGRHPELGYNVIYHEFAHKLDMLDGAADGTPPLRNRAEYRNWVLICSREYQRLRHDTAMGKKSFLKAYGATSEAEFFAVATEQFFDQPRLMIEQAPDLYRVLQEYYRQNPSERVGTIMKPVKRKVIADYKSPYPESIKFEKGEQVRIGEKFHEDSDWENWYWCEGQHGKKAWVPIQYIDIDGGKSTINTPYDARELTIRKGEILETFEEVNGFTMAINSKGIKGWAPLKNLVPVIE